MAIKTDIRGMVHDYPDYFLVGREKIREYATAVKADDPAHHDEEAAAELGHDRLIAPLTFVSTLALLLQQDFFRKVDTGFETMQIVQVDQKFVYHKPIRAGDKVWARMEVQSVVERFGADIVVTRNLAIDENGELFLESFTTLMGHEGDNSIQVKWDPETGQVMRTPPDPEPVSAPEPVSTPGAID
jgi:acyl dehydratase